MLPIEDGILPSKWLSLRFLHMYFLKGLILTAYRNNVYIITVEPEQKRHLNWKVKTH